MKKEYYRKSRQCETCVFHCYDLEAHKESCKSAGYYLWDDLEPATICFDALTEEQWNMLQNIPVSLGKRAEKWYKIHCSNNAKWTSSHKCRSCAFFGENGHNGCEHDDREDYETYPLTYRCRGYYQSVEEKEGECHDYLTVEQWAIIQNTPKNTGERAALWEKFREQNYSIGK